MCARGKLWAAHRRRVENSESRWTRPGEHHTYLLPGGTIPYEKNQHLLAAFRCASARLARIPSVQRTQSLVRKCSAGPEHWIPFCQHDYDGAGAGGLCSHCKWWSVCFVLCGAHQRDGPQHPGRKQYAVASHDHSCRDFRSWNGQCDGQHSERELRRFGLFKRWNQRRTHLDYYLTGECLQEQLRRLSLAIAGRGKAAKIHRIK